MMVINWTFVSRGRFAMYNTDSATCFTSNGGSTSTDLWACGTPRAVLSVIGVAALPRPHTMVYLRPSREVDLVRPVTPCLVAVYGAEKGRGTCADIGPLLIMPR